MMDTLSQAWDPRLKRGDTVDLPRQRERVGDRRHVASPVAIVWTLIDDDLGPRYGILVLAAVGAVAINALLKAILGPTPLELSVRGSFASGNFPSGHVVYITSLCSLLGWFALARGHRATFAAMLLLILGMGPFRILDGARWPSDVLAGYALGLAWTIAVLVLGLP